MGYGGIVPAAPAEAYLRIKVSSSWIPVLVFEQELIHDEHSQRNELSLGHLCGGDLS
jgi:hypothetical protein